MTVQALQKKFLPSLAPEDFFVLLAEATSKDKAFLLAHPEYELRAETEAKAQEYFARRLRHEPVAYIVGHKEFYGRDFRVTPATLIPRPETELLVELTLNEISNFQFPISKKIILIDVGTGSGNIIITLAKEISYLISHISSFSFHATDISLDALTVAKENSKRHHVDHLISFHQGDLLTPIIDELREAEHIIITANLPYLSETIYDDAEDDVKDFEPRSALISDEEGLAHSYRLLEQLHALTARKSLDVFFEISPEQSSLLQDRIRTLFPESKTTIHPDLSGRDRIVSFSLFRA